MNILLAFDSFKSCLSASEACQAAAEGIRARFPDAHIVSLPVSDGGEGMLEAISTNLSLTSVTAIVHNPLMQPCAAVYGLSPDSGTAYIESAAACGFATLPASTPLPLREAGRVSSSYGLGELILHAIEKGARRLVIGLGGTATCDGGRGLAECLRPHLPLPVEVIGVSDVRNPLYGPQGAAYVFGPQKGATPEQLCQFSTIVSGSLQKRLCSVASPHPTWRSDPVQEPPVESAMPLWPTSAPPFTPA